MSVLSSLGDRAAAWTLTYLEVDMLQAAHHNTVDAILGDLQSLVLAQLLVVEEATEDDVVESTFVLETLNVLRGMGIDALKRADKLVVETLDV